MKVIAITLFIVYCVITIGKTQCEQYRPTGHAIFHANNIRTIVQSSGDLFWDYHRRFFQAPFTGSSSPNALHSASIWLGGYDDFKNLKIAANTNLGYHWAEFNPGPLTASGMLFSDDCSHWDKVWSVRRYEIIHHIMDYAENGQIDHVQEAIYAWPGAGNPFFKEFNGFDMPDEFNSYAPFDDFNHNGIYEPHLGEHPVTPFLHANFRIPEQMTWSVFNDVREHTNSGGEPLHVEIHHTTYALYCDKESVLNSTIFMDFKLISRYPGALDSLYFGFFLSPRLGCYLDDHFGSAPEHNAFFVYNKNNDDGAGFDECHTSSVISYGVNPPVLSVSYMHHELTSCTYTMTPRTGTVPDANRPPLPGNPLEFYRYLTGSWRDGTPMTIGGTGYNLGSTNITRHAFHGNPLDTGAWQMFNVDFPDAYFTIVGAVDVGILDPGYVKQVPIAITLHHDPERDHLGNVQLMYEELPLIREQYFELTGCYTIPSPTCFSDCVWPGDVNADGLVNIMDFLALGLLNGQHGPSRKGPLSWSPRSAEDWDVTGLDGANAKHADVNGDGFVHFDSDFDILKLHAGYTHSGYTAPELVFQEGPELRMYRRWDIINPSSLRTFTHLEMQGEFIDSLYGFAFTLVYNPKIFYILSLSGRNSPFAPAENTFWTNPEDLRPENGQLEFGNVLLDGQNRAIEGNTHVFAFVFGINPNGFTPGRHDTVEVRLANIRGILNDGTEVPMGANKVTFIFLDETVSVDDQRMEPAVSVYPVPSSGVVYLEVPQTLVGSDAIVYDITGKHIETRRIDTTVSTLSLTPGMYLLAVHGTHTPVVRKLVILDE